MLLLHLVTKEGHSPSAQSGGWVESRHDNYMKSTNRLLELQRASGHRQNTKQSKYKKPEMQTSMKSSLFHLKILFLSDLYTRRGTQTLNREIESHALPTEPARNPAPVYVLKPHTSQVPGPDSGRDPEAGPSAHSAHRAMSKNTEWLFELHGWLGVACHTATEKQNR